MESSWQEIDRATAPIFSRYAGALDCDLHSAVPAMKVLVPYPHWPFAMGGRGDEEDA